MRYASQLPRSRRSRSPVLAGLFLLTMAAPAKAQNSVTECSDVYVHAQVLQKGNKILEAADEALRCAKPSCGELLLKECTQLYESLQSMVSTVVFAATDGSDHDIVDVTVAVDGTVLKDKLDGVAVRLDPGVHVIRFELKSQPPIEQKITVRSGEKLRVITEKIADPKEEPRLGPRASGPSFQVVDKGPAVEERSGPPTWYRTAAITSGILGAAGMAAFGGLWAQAMSDFSRLQTKCSAPPHCTASTVNGDASNDFFNAAYLSLGVGIVGLASGATFTLLSLGGPDTKGVRVTPTASGLRLDGMF